jgi:hypothetical protein
MYVVLTEVCYCVCRVDRSVLVIMNVVLTEVFVIMYVVLTEVCLLLCMSC